MTIHQLIKHLEQGDPAAAVYVRMPNNTIPMSSVMCPHCGAVANLLDDTHVYCVTCGATSRL